MADEAPEHGFVTAACEGYGCDVGLGEGGEVVTVEDFEVGIVGEDVGVEVGEAGEGVVDGVGWVVDEMEGFLRRHRRGLGGGFCCGRHDGWPACCCLVLASLSLFEL